MYKNLFFCTLIIMMPFCGCIRIANHTTQSVNAVIGDESFIQKFGYQPNATSDNSLRIKTHLEYVERVLRSKDISSLPAALQKQRGRLLSMLHTYWSKGIFPKNYDYAERRPCFIDKDGNICAVGYLIEKTAGRSAAEAINARFKYEDLLAMEDIDIDRWIASSGLTKEECAMIQPTYGGMPGMPTTPAKVNTVRITPFIGISSAIIGAGNLTLTAINVNQALRKTDNNNTVPFISLITGATQIVVGAEMLNEKPKVINYIGPGGAGFPTERASTPSEERNYKSLSKAHIAIGSATMISAAWKLLTNKVSKVERSSWNISSFETHDRHAAVSLNFTRRF